MSTDAARPRPDTTAGGPSPVRPHAGYRHEALLWRGEDDFLAGTVPFVREGVDAGQPVMVAVIAPRIAALADALGPDAAEVHFVDMAQLGRNPAHIIPAWRRFVDERSAGGQPVRGIGEPIWAGRRAVEIVECQLHEALLNLAVAPGTPLWLLCPYDAVSLPEAVLLEAQRSHPALLDGDDYRGSTLYGGTHHVSAVFATDLPVARRGGSAVRHVVDRGTLHDLRGDVLAHARRAGLSTDRGEDLALAVHEVAANSVRHGRGGGVLRVWRETDALVCEIRDGGRIDDPMSGRLLPRWQQESGRGLWMAHHLCDLVQVRSGEMGTTIRMHAWL